MNPTLLEQSICRGSAPLRKVECEMHHDTNPILNTCREIEELARKADHSTTEESAEGLEAVLQEIRQRATRLRELVDED